MEDYLPELKLSQSLGERQLEMKMNTPESLEACRKNLLDAYTRIRALLIRYMDIKQEYYDLIPLWIIGTYYHNSFPSYPFLFFNAMRGSGKTRLLKLISKLSAKGDGNVLNSITESVVFRTTPGTILCLDELESINGKDKNALRELLNAAYKKGVKVLRNKKVKIDGAETFIPEVFTPYCPICIANINGIEEVLSDRAITLILEKSNDPKKTKMVEDFDDNPEFKLLTELLVKSSVVSVVKFHPKNIYTAWNDFLETTYTTHNTYISNNNNTTLTTSPEVPEVPNITTELFIMIDKLGIVGRNLELLFPLLLLAKSIDNDLFQKIAIIGQKIVLEKRIDEYTESTDVAVYEYVSRKGEFEGKYLKVRELTEEFKFYIGDSGQEESWVNEKSFGRALKRLGLVINKRRISTGTEVMINTIKAKEKIKMFKTDEQINKNEMPNATL